MKSFQKAYLVVCLLFFGCSGEIKPKAPGQIIMIPEMAAEQAIPKASKPAEIAVAKEKEDGLAPAGLYFDPLDDDRLAEAFLTETLRLGLPPGTRCAFWNPLLDQGRSAKAFLLRIDAEGIRLDAMRVAEGTDLQKMADTFEKRGVRLSGIAGKYGWKRVCKIGPSRTATNPKQLAL